MRQALRVSISMLLTFSLVSSASAANFCSQVYTTDSRLTSVDGQQILRIRSIGETQAKLQNVLARMPVEWKPTIEQLLDSSYFVDYADMAKTMLPNFLSNSRVIHDYTRTYDRLGETQGAPFKGYLRARDYLRTEKPAVTADLILNIHRRAMEGGVETVLPEQLGTWKDRSWRGNATGSAALTEAQVATIKSNPYLTFDQTGKRSSTAVTDKWETIKFWSEVRNATLPHRQAPTELIEGYIRYPSIESCEQRTVDIIKDTNPELWTQINTFRAQNPKKSAPSDLEAAFTKALTEERFQRFSKDREALGPLTAENTRSYIDLVADLQRDLVSIHPVSNGNGRSTRLLMNYLLEKEGLPQARLLDPNQDIQSSVQEWRDAVYRAVVNSADMQADIASRLENGWAVANSPDLVYPGISLKVKIDARKEGSDVEKENAVTTSVEHNQFTAFVAALVKMHPELAQEIRSNRLASMDRLNEIFTEWYRSKTIQYAHSKDGVKELRLQLVEQDFIDTFGVLRAENKTLWNNKMERFYDRTELMWRGLSSKTHEYTDAELLSFFLTPSTHMASNQVVRQSGLGQSVVKRMKEDFEQYNKELIDGNLIQMAIDHHQTGPRYATSYGYSTSKREVVAHAFAMGAMVIAEYGKQNNPELQKQLKSRISVASYRAEKDVDLGRLRQFVEKGEYTYEYGRQAEIMGIGGTDADAILLVQRIGADGEVIETFARSQDNPAEILRVKGRWTPETGAVPTEQITARYQIRSGALIDTATQQTVVSSGQAQPAPLKILGIEIPGGKAEQKPNEGPAAIEPEKKGVFGFIKNLFFGK